MASAYEIGQTVHLIPSRLDPRADAGDYVVRRRNDLDTDEPNYVIESKQDQRMRREPHSRLTAVDAAGAKR
jgi:hypothetical protein